MRIIQPEAKILFPIDGVQSLKHLELIGRVCYKSEDKISDDSYIQFLQRIVKSGHESVIEHEKITVKLVCDRGVSHELVRHRIASFSQESTRYCNYSNEKFGSELTVIHPLFWGEEDNRFLIWKNQMQQAENAYFELLRLGASPQEARSVLPNSLKTEIVITMNMREWRHFFRLRMAPAAHPQMREICAILLDEFLRAIPVLFDEFKPLLDEYRLSLLNKERNVNYG